MLILTLILGTLFAIVFVGTIVHLNGTGPGGSGSRNNVPSAEHLRRARAACGDVTVENNRRCLDTAKAQSELSFITKSAPKYQEALTLSASIQSQAASDFQTESQANQREMASKEEHSREQMVRNVEGAAHDSFTCSSSAGKGPTMSFDNGLFWWEDDGRCAALAHKEAAATQRRRDADAKSSSYWPTTLRVDTDMDSFWLPNEERTCQTLPGDDGRLAVVACSATGSHRDHNIPVKFWGGVDRNTVSDWKCRREKGILDDQFVCRAVD